MAPLAIITCLFNAQDNATRLHSLSAFRASLGDAAPLLHIAECIVGDAPSRLSGLPGVEVFRTRSVLWQKERLLTLMLDRLPAGVEAVAWVDADIVFENPDWWRAALHALRDADVLQPFAHVVEHPPDRGDTPARGFAANVTRAPDLARERFHLHGHTGYAWVARADALRRGGFFDACVLGGADHIMAHGFLGHTDAPCLAPLLDQDGPQMAAYRAWIDRSGFAERPLRIAALPDRIRHLRHGSPQGRQYMLRNRLLRESGFDPARHLETNRWGCWEWTADAAEQRDLAMAYFAARVSDDAVA